MSFQLNRNLKFNKTNYDNRPILVGDIIYCENETGYYIGRCHWIDKRNANFLYIEDIAEAFSVYDCRLANEKERGKYIWSRNYMYSYFYFESKKKPKPPIKDIIGKGLCFIPIPVFGFIWFIFYGVYCEKVIANSNTFLSSLFMIHLLSMILGFIFVVASL